MFGCIYPLTSIFNCSLREGLFPTAWKLANIIHLQYISDRIMNINGHIGKGISNFEMNHGGHGYGQQNLEVESILSFAQAYHCVVANTYFL